MRLSVCAIHRKLFLKSGGKRHPDRDRPLGSDLADLGGIERISKREGVAVGVNRERTDVALRAEMIGEEALDENGEWIGSHGQESLKVGLH